MDETLRHQRDTSLGQIDRLIQRGREIRDQAFSVDVTRAWQLECAAAINQLSGGSKAHWLARAFSGAFMVRSTNGGVVVEADAAEILDRILDVLAQGAASLTRMDDVEVASTSGPPRARRFEFVHNTELRPVLEQTFDDSRDALERAEFGLALILSCGVIEAVITDALDHVRAGAHDAVDARITEWSFEKRIAAAESAGLIRSGCNRLPPVARQYRDLTDADGDLRADASVSEREAKLAGQVLRVVMRDLDPGR